MKIYVYGAGEHGKRIVRQFRWITSRMSLKDEYELVFIDRDDAKVHSIIEGCTVISIEEAISEGATNGMVLCTVDDMVEPLKNRGFKIVICNIKQLEYFFPDIEIGDYKFCMPFNHYESTYLSEHEIVQLQTKEKDDIEKKLMGIDLNLDKQEALLREFVDSGPPPIWYDRWIENNSWFDLPAANLLYYMMRKNHPKRIIEIGSGYSTAAMLDISDYCLDGSVEVYSIEPYPSRLNSLIRDGDRVNVIKDVMQNVPLSYFEKLEENDFLFVDSSHVIKHGGDVNRIFFEVLPVIAQGVHVHIHDVFFPFRYPLHWVRQGRPYGEMYLLRAFLMYNKDYSIEFFPQSGYACPPGWENFGVGSFWMKKKASC